MATFYKWDDSGAPGRNLSGNIQNRMLQILRACLVDGYGSKAPAGWSMVHQHDNGFSMTNGPQSGIFNFVSGLTGMRAYDVHVYLAETAGDTSQAIIGGTNVKSGLYTVGQTDPGTRHAFSPYDITTIYLSSLVWHMVADEKSFALNMVASNVASNDWGTYSLYIGETLNDVGLAGTATFVALGGGIHTTGGTGQYKPFSFGNTVLRDQLTGLIGGATTQAWPYLQEGTMKTLLPDGLPADLQLQQARLYSDTSFVGRLRGVLLDDVLFRTKFQFSLRAMGLSETVSEIGKVVTVGGIPLALAASYYANGFHTTDAGYW